MTQLKKNVTVFEQDVLENEAYRYTTNAGFSSVVANRRMTEATLKWLGPELHQVLDAGCGDGTYTHELKVARPDLQIAGYDAAEVAVGGEAELDVDIGEAEIAVEQQGLAAGTSQRVGKGDREPGLADTTLAGRDGDDVPPFRQKGGARR